MHALPVKREGDIGEVPAYGVDTFVVDTDEELSKKLPYAETIMVLIRLPYPCPNAVVDVSGKFGCGPRAVPQLLATARDLGVKVRGLSFHVGSQAIDPAKYVEAIRVCVRLIERAAEEGLARFDTLDIG